MGAALPRTILDIAQDLRERSVSAAELLDDVLSRADRLDEQLHVYATRFDEAARAAAAAADADFAAGVDRGPLQGVPVAVKDMILTKEAPTRAGSDVQNPAWRRRIDAPVVSRLRAAGAVLVGKTTTAELAFGVPDTAYLERETRNPWDSQRWAGGSSAGSAAGLAPEMFFGSVGTDTGGSIRIPAAYCGVVGLRPTLARLSCEGVIPLARSLDVVGPLARTATDVAVLLQAMDAPGVDSRTDLHDALRHPIRGLRIGVARTNHTDRPLAQTNVVARFEDAVSELAGMGAIVSEVTLPDYAAGVNAVLVTMLGEACAEHLPELRQQWNDFAPATRRSMSSGLLLRATDLAAAQRVISIIRRKVARLYRSLDAIVCLATVSVAPVLGALSLEDLTESICTDYWSAVGNPVLCVPIGFDDDGMPVGMQIAGRPTDEATIVRVGDAYQQETGWHLSLPPVLVAESE
jgi:aspartyl-tRNA(Asn)/glutamyl-tRNA(Gln) amidotransferase subunit A